MAKIVEVTSSPASTAHLDNPLKYYRAFNGVEVEDKGTGWALVGWESVEHHIRMSDHPAIPTSFKRVSEHLNAMKMNDTESAVDGKALTELAEFTIVHVPLHTPDQE
ncbi:hypothetical protein MPER_12289 [Moniliophthora perniciosa FA553]|nr:hypothetical protein MPER_12289 [Moniliophthora perniciosa FA553]